MTKMLFAWLMQRINFKIKKATTVAAIIALCHIQASKYIQQSLMMHLL